MVCVTTSIRNTNTDTVSSTDFWLLIFKFAVGGVENDLYYVWIRLEAILPGFTGGHNREKDIIKDVVFPLGLRFH